MKSGAALVYTLRKLGRDFLLTVIRQRGTPPNREAKEAPQTSSPNELKKGTSIYKMGNKWAGVIREPRFLLPVRRKEPQKKRRAKSAVHPRTRVQTTSRGQVR